MQDGRSSGRLPGGEGPQGAETWSRAHCGELDIALAGLVARNLYSDLSDHLSPQTQYQIIFDAVLTFLDSFDTYANF